MGEVGTQNLRNLTRNEWSRRVVMPRERKIKHRVKYMPNMVTIISCGV